MMTTTPKDLRATARVLPLVERRRRLATVHSASDSTLLRAVVAAGVGGGEWRSSSDCAERAFVVSSRAFRRWLEDDRVILSDAVRMKLERLAFAFGVEIV